MTILSAIYTIIHRNKSIRSLLSVSSDVARKFINAVYLSHCPMSMTHFFLLRSPRPMSQPVLSHLEAEVRQTKPYEVPHRCTRDDLFTSQLSHPLPQRLSITSAECNGQMLRHTNQSELHLPAMGTRSSRRLQSVPVLDHVCLQRVHHLRHHSLGAHPHAQSESVCSSSTIIGDVDVGYVRLRHLDASIVYLFRLLPSSDADGRTGTFLPSYSPNLPGQRAVYLACY